MKGLFSFLPKTLLEQGLTKVAWIVLSAIGGGLMVGRFKEKEKEETLKNIWKEMRANK